MVEYVFVVKADVTLLRMLLLVFAEMYCSRCESIVYSVYVYISPGFDIQ